MIQTEELRLGNFVQSNKDIEKVKSLQGDEINYNYEYCYSGIPLTEDILLKCGANPISVEYYNINGFLFDINKDGIYFTAFDRDGLGFSNDFSTKIEYLHQLQNLYFALIGKELEVKL